MDFGGKFGKDGFKGDFKGGKQGDMKGDGKGKGGKKGMKGVKGERRRDDLPYPEPVISTAPGNAARTIHVTGIDPDCDEVKVTDFFNDLGRVTQCKLAGDTSHPTRFGFVEMETPEQAAHAVTRSQRVYLCGRPLKIVPSKTAIVSPTNPTSTTEERTGPALRTVYVAGIPSHMSENQIIAHFKDKVGTVTNFKLCGDASQPSRFAFIELGTDDLATKCIKLDGSSVEGNTVRITPSRTAILSSGCGTLGSSAEPASIEVKITGLPREV